MATDTMEELAEPLVTPMESDRRPWDLSQDAGPPADPISFLSPRIHRGRRVEVVCYNPATGAYERLTNVLLSDEGTRELAYYPHPRKKQIKTIMGYVEISVVLKRRKKEEDTVVLKHRKKDEDTVVLKRRKKDKDTGVLKRRKKNEDTAVLKRRKKDEENVVLKQKDEDTSVGDAVFELTEEYVAVKVNYVWMMQSLKGRHAEDPMKEIAAMQLIGDQSPHFMGCRDVLYDAETKALNVIMRYCPHGDLFELLQDFQNRETKCLSEPQARFWMGQILEGLKHLRDLGICHNDLSPENIMIDHKKCVIIDLGICSRVPYTDPKTGLTTSITNGSHKRLFSPQGARGKLPYISPEIYRNRQPFDGELADVWAAGTVLFCVLTGSRSYGRPHATDPQFDSMTNGLEQMLRGWKVPISRDGLHLLQNLLQVNPRLRLTLDEALDHPWFRLPHEEMNLATMRNANEASNRN